MDEHGFLIQALIYLGAGVIAVPIFKRLGLGSVLGYLAAGMVLGPWGLKLVSKPEAVLHFAEFGVVLLLFLVGLELNPQRLWNMRRPIFGMGAAQVIGTIAAVTAIGWALNQKLTIAVVAGMGIAMSSTAIVLATLQEKRLLATPGGQASFSVLLFQDLAVIPLALLLALLSPEVSRGGMDWIAAGRAVAMIALLIAAGHFLLRPLLRVVASAGQREVFVGFALLIVLGVAALMEKVGLSMALGAFLAGVMLAESEYRHELELDIEPFKGLLLGLFFISVGMSLNLGMIVASPGIVAALVAGLVAIKLAVLYGVGRMNGLGPASARALAISISQGGEFAFVIFAAAAGTAVLDPGDADLLKAVVTLSMATTPILAAGEAYLMRRRTARLALSPVYDEPPEEQRQVIIAGFGRFGQIVARILRAKKIPFTALEISPDQVDFVRGFGNEVFYGDASRIDLLRAAKADRAAALVLAIDDPDASVRTAKTARDNFPDLPVYARARNRNHAYRLMDVGVKVVWRETFLSSIDMARAVLQGLGISEREAKAVTETFRRHDERRLAAHHGLHNDERRMQDLAKAATRELEELFAADVAEAESEAQASESERRKEPKRA